MQAALTWAKKAGQSSQSADGGAAGDCRRQGCRGPTQTGKILGEGTRRRGRSAIYGGQEVEAPNLGCKVSYKVREATESNQGRG
uniref:Uncharacterized protein n=1 Tax=Oryza brachyantha TaxID=4533 RepID=J3N1B0_ORYBR